MIYKLGDICTITKGETGIMKAIDGNYTMITLGEDNKTHNEFQFDTKAVIIPLVSSTGHGHASMKRVKFAEGKFALGSILCAVIPKNENFVLAKYLHIYLHENREKLLVSIMKGAANVSLPIKRISEVQVFVPSIEKQKSIINLEENIIKSELELKETIIEQTQLLVQLRQSILQEAIQGKLTETWRAENPQTEPAALLLKRIKAEKEKLIQEKKIKKEKPLPPITKDEIPFELPEGWVWCRLGEVVTFQIGKTPATKQSDYWVNGVHNWLSISDMENYGTILRTNKKITNSAALECFKTQKIVPIDTLLMSFKLTVGRVSINKIPLYHNEAIVSIYPLTGILQSFLFNLLSSITNLSISKKVLMGQTFNSASISNLYFPLPPLSEQQAIVEKVEALMQQCSALNEEIGTLNEHGKLLLKALFNETFAAKQ